MWNIKWPLKPRNICHFTLHFSQTIFTWPVLSIFTICHSYSQLNHCTGLPQTHGWFRNKQYMAPAWESRSRIWRCRSWKTWIIIMWDPRLHHHTTLLWQPALHRGLDPPFLSSWFNFLSITFILFHQTFSQYSDFYLSCLCWLITLHSLTKNIFSFSVADIRQISVK